MFWLVRIHSDWDGLIFNWFATNEIENFFWIGAKWLGGLARIQTSEWFEMIRNEFISEAFARVLSCTLIKLFKNFYLPYWVRHFVLKNFEILIINSNLVVKNGLDNFIFVVNCTLLGFRSKVPDDRSINYSKDLLPCIYIFLWLIYLTILIWWANKSSLINDCPPCSEVSFEAII